MASANFSAASLTCLCCLSSMLSNLFLVPLALNRTLYPMHSFLNPDLGVLLGNLPGDFCYPFLDFRSKTPTYSLPIRTNYSRSQTVLNRRYSLPFPLSVRSGRPAYKRKKASTLRRYCSSASAQKSRYASPASVMEYTRRAGPPLEVSHLDSTTPSFSICLR